MYAPDFDFVDQTPVLRGLRRFDLDSGAVQEATLWDGPSAGEAIFVPADASAPQDEGWVLSVVYDAASDTSSLVILDAGDFAAGPVARVHLPTRGPVGFHGTWIPAER